MLMGGGYDANQRVPEISWLECTGVVVAATPFGTTRVLAKAMSRSGQGGAEMLTNPIQQAGNVFQRYVCVF